MIKNRIIQLALALFVGLIFISTYISRTNYNSEQVTTSIPQTIYAFGFANVSITGYGTPMSFNLTSNNSALRSAAANIIVANLTTLYYNSSILNYPYLSGTSISVAPENMSVQQVYSFISSKLNSTLLNSTIVYATTSLSIPQVVNVSTGGPQKFKILIPEGSRNASITLPIKYKVGDQLKAKISMLVTANGLEYGPISLIIMNVTK